MLSCRPKKGKGTPWEFKVTLTKFRFKTIEKIRNCSRIPKIVKDIYFFLCFHSLTMLAMFLVSHFSVAELRLL